MKKLSGTITAIVFAAAVCLGSAAAYGEVSNPNTALLRGRQIYEYKGRYNGHIYWDGPEYRKGDVFFDGRLYTDVLLNINANTQDLYVRIGENSFPVIIYRDLVAWFRMDGITYVNMRYAGYQDFAPGYFQLYKDGTGRMWYRQVTKVIRSEIGEHNGEDGIGYYDPKYNPEILHYFQYIDRYYSYDRKGKLKSYSSGKVWRRYRPGATGEIPPLQPAYLEEREFQFPDSGVKLRENAQMENLPTGYFDDGSAISDARRNMAEFLEQERIIADSRNKTYLVGDQDHKAAQGRVHGIIRDVATGEALSGVLVSDASGAHYTHTADDGSYSLTLPAGEGLITLQQYSMEDMAFHVVVYGDGELDLLMREKITALKSAYVSAEGMADHRRTSMGVEKLNIKVLNKIPTAFGEGDVLKAMMTLPGVKTVGEAASGFNVRGGSADQNLILFNEGTIYNPSHMFGIFSAFNPDVVEDVELYKSSIPVRYGGRISSVMDVRSKDGDRNKIKGSLGIGILTSHAAIEGPFDKEGKTTFVLGGRATYSNWMLKILPKNSGYSGGKANFADVNASITHRFDDRSTLQAYGYWSYDKFSFSGDTTFRYMNINAALRYTKKYDGGRQMVIAGGYDQYGNTLDNYINAARSFSLETAVRQTFARAQFVHPMGHHTLSYGADAVFYFLNPGTRSPYGKESLVMRKQMPTGYGLEPSVYAGDSWNIAGGPFSLDYGVRISGFMAMNPAKFYLGPDLRVSGKYSPLPNLSFKAGFNSMTQYVHMISNTAGISPMDTWQISTDKIKPQRGWQVAAGAYWSFADAFWDLSVEGYYKRCLNSLDYKSGAQLQMNDNLADDLVPVRNQSYGVEVMLKKSKGRLTGWLSYTYSRSLLQEMTDRGVLTINRGEWYNAPHDKPHDIKLVANYAFTHRYSLSVNLDYSTGRPVTVPVGQYYYEGAIRLAYSDRNSYRIPDYFRMDVAFNIDPGHFLKALTHCSCTIGCYNVTARKNAYSVFYTTNGGQEIKGHMVSVFATPIPYLTINLKF